MRRLYGLSRSDEDFFIAGYRSFPPVGPNRYTTSLIAGITIECMSKSEGRDAFKEHNERRPRTRANKASCLSEKLLETKSKYISECLGRSAAIAI
jgi:hypothetical protein